MFRYAKFALMRQIYDEAPNDRADVGNAAPQERQHYNNNNHNVLSEATRWLQSGSSLCLVVTTVIHPLGAVLCCVEALCDRLQTTQQRQDTVDIRQLDLHHVRGFSC